MHHNSVHDDFNRVLDILIKLDFFRKIILASVDSGSHVARSFCPVQSFRVFTFFAPYNRRKDLKLGTLSQCHDLVAHLIHSLSSDLTATVWTVRNTDSCVKKSEMIVNFCHSTNSRSGILVGGLLVYGNCRRKSLYPLNIRLVHLAQEHSRVGRERFHIPSLSLCKNGVKCQR